MRHSVLIAAERTTLHQRGRASLAAVLAVLTAVLAALLDTPADAQPVLPPDPAPTLSPHLGGAWGPVLEWPHVPVTMANLPDGRILTFASNEPNDWPVSRTDEYTHAAVWDPETGSIRSVPHPSHDMFCAAVVTLESGETFVMGGRNAANSPWVSYYDFHADRWIQLAPSQDMNKGRWYPTAVYMGSGEIFIAAGIGGDVHPELWREGSGWTLLTGIDLTSTMLSLGYRDGGGTWPLLQLAPDGTIFHHGATPGMNSIDPFGGPGGLGTISDLGPHDFGWFPDEGVSVSYDEGRILVAGGSTSAADPISSASAYTIDVHLAAPGPTLSATASMHYPRQFMNEVMLPNGDVLVVGGNTNGVKFDDRYAIRNAESWDPESGSWTLLNPQDQARTYHSTALLLLDGRVLSAGGGLNDEPCSGTGSPGECGVDHWNAEIYSPPYLFESDGSLAPRPVLESAPGVARVGRTITVHATPGLTGFSMIRMSGTTHTMNTDQRFLRPSMVETSPGTYALTLHSNEHVLVPGYWMLFALAGEVPSVALPIQIVNDGRPRGPSIDALLNDLGDVVLYEIEMEDPDGGALSYLGTNLPPGLSLSPTTGIISGTATAPGIFNVQLLVTDGVDSASIEFPWTVSQERSELGALSPAPDVWNTATLANHYEQPVVVLGLASMQDPRPLTVRVRNVTSTSFEYRIAGWPALSGGAHDSESLSYMVVEAGEYVLPGGGTLVAGIARGIDYLNPWEQTFTPGAFTTTPSVFTQIGTTLAGADSPPATARIEGVSAAGFRVRIQEQESDDQNFPAEDVHWITVEPAALPGVLETVRSPLLVDENASSVAFTQGFSSVPHLFASLQSSFDLDTVTLRQQKATSAGFDLFAQEETSLDAELDHLPEIFGWLAIDPAAATLGLLPLFNTPPSIAPPADQASRRDDVVSLVVEAVDPEGGPLFFSATGLPNGLSIDAATGEIAGTITQAGAFVVTVTATDTSSDEDSAVFLWEVEEPLELVRTATPPRTDGSAIEFTAATNIAPDVAGSYVFSWDFGDGSSPVGPSSSPTAQHTFPAPGRYGVTLTVSDSVSGQTDSLQFVQIVTPAATANAPTATSTIAYDAASSRLWAVSPDQDTVALIDAASHSRLAEIPVSRGPRTLAVAADGRVWVACKEASVIDVIDPGALAVTASHEFKAGSAPHGVVFDPAGATAFVAFEGTGEILRLDGVTASVLASASVGRNVRHLAVSADGSTLYAPRFVTPPLPNEARSVPLAESAGQPIGGEVLRLEASTLLPGPTAILEVSTIPDSATGARGVPNYLGAPAISPDGTRLIVPSKQDNVFRGGLRDGQVLVHDRTVRAITSTIDLATGREHTLPRVDHDDSSVASAALFARLGAYAFTALEGSRQIAILDPFSNVELGRFTAGRAPHGMALSPDGSMLYVDNFMDRSVSVFDLSGLLDYDDPAPVEIATVSKVASEALDADILLGKQLFYDSADDRLALQDYLACAACHSEGGQDGRVWDFSDLGEGLRNSIGLRGHGVGQGRLHWTANFDELQDFEGQIRHFGGSGLMSAADFEATRDPLGPPKAGRSAALDALAAYMASLTETGASPARASDGSLTPEGVVGRGIFEAEGCGRCHVGPQFTDSDQALAHDVGTLEAGSGPQTALDTPTLRGLWRTAPYLHDGSAATLEAAIAAHDFVTPGPAELASLAAYLEQIDDAETTAPNATPTVELSAPADGSAFMRGEELAFSATASDIEDGDLTASIEWTSSLDGALGSGGSASGGALSAGTHTITARASDSRGETGASEITLTITPTVGPTVTITSPVEASVVTQTLPVDFTASARDPVEGDLAAEIVWTSSLDGMIGSGASFSRSDLSLGVHAITAFVTGAGDLPDSDQRTLTIAPNAAPSLAIASPSDGSELAEAVPVDLIAGADDAEDGELSSTISWSSSLSGPLGTGGLVSLGSLPAGAHTLTASISDSLGETVTDQVSLTVAPNSAPTLVLGSPLVGTSEIEGVLVHFGATASDAEDGELSASISWTSSVDGTLGTGGSFDLATLSVGLHTITATVSDAVGAPGSAQTTLDIVENQAPVVTISAPAEGSTSTAGVPVTFTAAANDSEDGELSAAIEWTSSLDGPLGIGASLELDTLTVGRHSISAGVSDSLGATTSDVVTLGIAPNAAPALTLTSPVDGSTATQGAVVDFVATASDPEDGDLTTSIDWSSSLAGPLGRGGSLSLDSLGLGIHTITASVVDSLDERVAVPIELTIAPNAPPTLRVTAPRNGAIEVEGALVDLIAGAEDAQDGDLTSSIEWSSSLDGPIGTGGSLQVGTLSVGVHALTASVTDSLDASVSSQVTLTIGENQAPVVAIDSPAPGSLFAEGGAVLLSGSASDREQGDLAASLTWSSSLDGALGVGSLVSRNDLASGVHTLTASATDEQGLSGSAQVEITIVANRPPVVSIFAPSDGDSVPEQTPIALSGSAIDAEDGDLSASLSWVSNRDGVIGSGASTEVPSLSIGTHRLAGFAVDASRASGVAEITLTVTANVAPTVVVDAPVALAEIALGESIDLLATATDPEDGDLSGDVVWTSSLDGTLGAGSPLQIDTLSEGLHGISVTATDRHGAVASAETAVSVPEPGLIESLVAGLMLLTLGKRRMESASRSRP